MLTTVMEDIEYVEENDDLTANPQFAESTPKHPLKSPQTPRSILRNKQVPDTESKKKLRFDNISKNIKVEIPSKPFDLPDLDDMHKELEQSRSASNTFQIPTILSVI